MNNIVGQKKAVNLLLSSAEGKRGHHAWVFCGPFGVGKCTSAIAYSKFLLDNHEDNNPDFHLIKKEDVSWSNNPALQKRKQISIPIDLLRERMIGGKTSDGKQHDAPVFKTPVFGKKKVFVIDEAELLDETAQNALLKTLEEPPVETTIILVTCREDLLLPTIKSRCQEVRFSPLDNNSMLEWVRNNGFHKTNNNVEWCIRFSCGSPGLFCEALETGIPELAGELSDFFSFNNRNDIGCVSDKLFGFIESNVARWVKENPQTSKESANRRAIQLILLLFGMYARQFVRNTDQELGVALAGVLSDIEKQLSTNISMKVLVESLATRWSSLCVGDAMFM